jgi:S1-C subfamily serine protease
MILSFALPVWAGPVPQSTPPDPLARGYMGVIPVAGTLVLNSIEPNTPAAKAGLRKGDAIVSIGDCTPATFDELVLYISSQRPGTLIRIVTRRGVDQQVFHIRLGNRYDYTRTSMPRISDENRP